MTTNTRRRNRPTENQPSVGDYLSNAWDAYLDRGTLLSPNHPAYVAQREIDKYKAETGHTILNDPDNVISGLMAEQAMSVGIDPGNRLPLGLLGTLKKPLTLTKKIKQAKFKRIKGGESKGQYIGAPEGIDTPQKLRKLIENKYGHLEEGVPGRNWYDESGREVKKLTQDKETANKVAANLGVTSAGSAVDVNLGATIKGHNQAIVGDPVVTGRFPKSMGPSISKIYEGKGPELGPKRTPFSNQIALGGGFDPNPETAKRAVHDIWDARASGFGDDFDKGLTTAQHEFLDNVDEIILSEANSRGLGGFEDWTTGRAQASIWVSKKSQKEGMTIEEGAKNYVDYLEKYVVQHSYETIPGKTTGHLPELHGMSPEFKEMYHQQAKAILTKGGHDKISTGFGFLSRGVIDAPGYFEGAISPGTQVRVLGGRAKGGEWADDATAKMSRGSEGTRGLLLAQDGIAWNQLGNAGEPLVRANAFDLRLGHIISEDELISIMDELVEKYGKKAQDHFAPVPSKTGMRLLYIGPPDKKLGYQKVGQLVKKIAKDRNIPITTHKNITKYPDGYKENDWIKLQYGQDYLPLINQTDNPVIKERFNAIAPDIADNLRRNDEKLAKKFGLTTAKHIQDMREAIARGGYDGLMKLIKTGVLPASIIGFIGTGLTQTQREMIGLVPQDSRAGS